MKKGIKIVICAAIALLSFTSARAQYFTWGASPSSIKWSRLRSDSIKLIYPTYWEQNARKALFLFDTIRPYISHGYDRGPARTPVIMHTQNMQSNGVVSYVPKRIELVTFPGIDGFAEPWFKQLIAHEYRHSVQFHNINRSTIKALSVLFGEQGFMIGSLVLPTWYMEGDAVMAETQMTTYGRALQPSFTMEYRALGKRITRTRNWQLDRWFCGSYRHHIPNHYKMGYQMTRWMYENLGSDIWNRISRYSSNYPFFIIPRTIYLKHHHDMWGSEIFRNTFNELAEYWESLPQVDDSAEKIATPIKSYTTYAHPQWLNDTTIVALKEDLANHQALVQVDSRTGDEKVLCYTGYISSRPTLGRNRIYWTEYRNSTVWAERVNSELCYYDFVEGRKRHAASKHQVFLPIIDGEGALCYVAWSYAGQFSIRQGFDYERNHYDFEPDIEIRSLAWDNATNRLYFIALDERGSWIGALNRDWSGYEEITEPRFITISDLRAQNGTLYFGSIVSGKDEAHSLDLATSTEYRITESNYGSFQPAPNKADNQAIVTTYDSMGYKLAVQSLDQPTPQPYRKLPVNLVNPPTTSWDCINLDEVQFTTSIDSVQRAKTPAKKYRKGLTGFNVHSWAPCEMDPFRILEDMPPDLNLGATVISQNLLSSMECFASWGWSRTMGSRYRIGVNYTGWGPTISFRGTYGGGMQMIYNRPDSVQMPSLRKALNLSLGVAQPLWLSTGYHMRRITPAIALNYTNDVFYHGATPHTGLIHLTGQLNYSEQVRMSHRDFAPKWGYSINLSCVSSPANKDFNTTLLASVKGYLPGVAAHHSTQLQVAFQAAVGDRDYTFRIKELLPRGAEYNFTPRRYLATAIDYQLPVAYPDWGIPSILFIRRIRVGAFFDYARYQTFDNKLHNLTSYGVSAYFDVVPISLPESANTTISVTIAKPSDRKGVVAFASIGIPL